MNPQFPVYIVSKGRAKSRLTSKALEKMGVPYRIIVEEQERNEYAAEIDPKKILILDKKYQRDYETCDKLGDTKSRGPGPARNFAWDHSISEGFSWHWVMDDNISRFRRLNRNTRHPVRDGTILRCMEDFTLRYENVAQAGPGYMMFAPKRYKHHNIIFNTRIYSCLLIRNDLPFRWRGRYNEDTDLSLRALKAGWCTLQFMAFLQEKMHTQTMKGGNTAEFYAKEGTVPKSLLLREMHPDVVDLRWRYGRPHHMVNYKLFTKNKLIPKRGVKIEPGINDYGMELISA